MNNKQPNKLSLDEKRLLLMKALQKKSGATEEVHPLSLFQEGLLFLSRLQPDSFQYNMPHVVRLRGKLDQAALERSVNEIVRRHAPLRTVFTISDEGQPQQIVKPFQPQPLMVVDLSTLPIDRREAQALQIVQEEGRHVFDLAKESPLRYQLIRLHEDEHWFLFVAHHIIFDLLSLEVFLKELGVLYGAFVSGQASPLADLAFSYPSFARWQRQWLQGEELSSQLAYWQQKLGGSLPVLELPTDHPRPAKPSSKGALYTFSIPETLTAALNTLGRQEGATLFMTLLAAFNVLLHRYTHQDDILIGTPMANRNRAEMANLIGLLINTLVLRTDLSGAPTFRQLLKRVQETALDAYSHQDVPFPKLVEIVQPDRSGGRTPIFQVLFALENASVHLEIPGLETSLLDSHHGTAKFDLALMVKEEANGLAATFEYSTDLFEEATICRMANHFVRLLASIVENPNQSITTLPLLSPEELEQLLVQWNDTAMKYPRQYTVHELVHQHAERRPHAIAVVAGNNHLTYAEFNMRADQLASYLRANGVGPDVLVGICMDRSLDMIVSMLGVLKAGGAYVPMDPAHPKERLAFLVEDSQAEVVLTHQHLLSRLPERLATYVCLDSDWEDIAQARPVPANRVVKGEHLAYMIYTSGSTGKPKGVGVTHDNLLNLVYWSLRTYQMTAEDRCSQICGAGFDVSVWEIWGTLSTGASLYLVDDETRRSPQKLRDWLLARKITRSFVPTPLAEELLTLPWPMKASLQHLFIGGDKLHSYPRPEIPFTVVNIYGPTECTVLVTATIVPSVADSERLPSIGRPIANTQLYVLDRNNQVVPVGIPGELHIGGSSVSRGYHRRPELTREKFIANPWSTNPADRLYKTGDLVRYLPDGTLEFLGRIDHQVKIRGFRIELGEIEVHLTQHPAVREAVVIAREDAPGNKRLVAYVVPTGEQEPVRSELREFLKQMLPQYMIPTAFVFLESIPLNANGKVDRRALPAPQTMWSEDDEHYVAPSTPTEKMLADLWRQLLGIEQVGREDNFFEHGGHSLLATRLVAAIRDVFMVELPLPCLFDHPTLVEVARVIDGQGEQRRMSTIRPSGRSVDQPLSFAQQRLWFLQQWLPDSPLYNIVIAYRLVGQLNVDLLERGINEIVRRHAALRTTFPIVGQEPVQRVAPALTIPVKVMNVDQVPAVERERAALHLLRQEGQQPFDLAHGPLVRATVVRLHEQEHFLLLNMHHIISDGWSMAVFVRELVTLYQAYANEQAVVLPEVQVQYTDFTEWQQHWLQGEVLEEQLKYWQRKLAGAPTVLELPTDHPRPPVQTFRGAQKSFVLLPALSEDLRSLSQKEGVTLFMTLLAAWATLLHRYSGQEELIIGVPIANRKRKEVEQLIGLFVNTLALRIDISGTPSFQALLSRVRETALEAYTYQDVPFEKLVMELHPERHLSHNPLFQVMFAFQNEDFVNFKLSNVTVSPLKLDIGTAMFDLTLAVIDTEQGLSVTLEYNTDLFDEATIDRMARHFQELLSAIVADPSESVVALSFLPEAEVAQLLFRWNATAFPSPQNRCIHSLFEEQVERTPEAIAVVCEDGQLSYRELNERANRLAHYLRTFGVGPEVMVGISVERSLAMIVGLFGILKASGAYVPIDPTYPRQRLLHILQDAQVPVLITTSNLETSFEEYHGKVICLDTGWCDIAQQEGGNPRVAASADTLMYVIYTSGSTGFPKGVMIPHRAACNHFCWMQQRFPLNREDCVLQHTSFSFDASVWELFAPLLQGAKLVLAQPEGEKDPAYMVKTIAEHHVTILQLVPSLLRMLLEEREFTKCTTLRQVFCGGEAMAPDDMEQFFSATMAELVNMYGPTETCIDATYWVCSREYIPAKIPIGRPVGNAQVYILDKHRQLVPIGIPGELYIGGHGLARGYLKRPELTAERFVANPFSGTPGTHLYRTGDLVRYLPDGNIEFLGRIDHQVKVRGFRIELGEIEVQLTRHPAVREAVVLAHEMTPGDYRLVAYVVANEQQAPADSELRSFLKESLPEYMVPAIYVVMDAFPLTPNGKIDRRALPPPPSSVPAAHTSQNRTTRDVPAGTSLEQTLTAIWKKILGRDTVGLHDNFFDLGGHSLLLVRMHKEICKTLETDIQVLDLFKYPTINALAQRIQGQPAGLPQLATQEEPMDVRLSLNQDVESDTDIAVIGMAGRFPGANDIETFWENVRDGVESIRWFSREELQEADLTDLDDPNFVPAKGIMEGADLFDAAFFGISPREAETIDPQQRVMLECAWEALEHAGYNPECYAGRIGVYAGSSLNTYLLNNLYPNKEHIKKVGMDQVLISNDKDFLTTRVAYKLNLKGPAVTVQTACSTSLVAIHMACQSLLKGECEMALAGGVSIQAPLKEGYVYREGDVMSPDGHCRAFDAQAKGTVAGTGIGLVVLKRLSEALRDGDNIWATIKGSAINNDGSMKVGYTAPSIDGQAEVITKALAAAGVHPETISYIEAHGTGTALGDPIEIEGLTKAFRACGVQQNGYCAVGSVKTNIGHLDTAAGVAGLLKTVLALQHKQLPASLNCTSPNPRIDFANSPFFVNTSLTEWSAQHGPRRASVSSFGIGGTNAHVILEEAPVAEGSRPTRPYQLLVLSARSRSSLQGMTERLLAYLKQQPDITLADVAYTLQIGRKEFKQRRMLLCHDVEGAIQVLEQADPQRLQTDQAVEGRSIVFLFPGQGSQYVNMARELYETEPVFRSQVDHCAQLLEPELGCDLRHVLFPADEQREATTQLNETWLTQPALFVIEYALATLWQSWGVHPQAMIGHSIGEYVAACLAGVFTVEDALALVATRGRLIQNCPKGSMLAVSLSEQETRSLLSDDVSIAAINGLRSTVVSGPDHAIVALQERLAGQGTLCRRLHTSHAFHSAMMESILEPFKAQLRKVKLAPPQVPFLSNKTGTWITKEEATDPGYWTQHLRSTVRFADGLKELFVDAGRVFLEVGPGNTLSTLTRQHPLKGPTDVVISSLRHPREEQSDLAVLLQALGRLWLSGVHVDWAGFSHNEKRHRVPLPTYPFERQRYWVDAPQIGVVEEGNAGRAVSDTQSLDKSQSCSLPEQHDAGRDVALPTNEFEEMIAQVWQDVLGISPLGIHDNFFELGADSLMMARVTNRLRELLLFDIPLSCIFEAPTAAGLARRIEDMLVEQLDATHEEVPQTDLIEDSL